MAVYPSSINAKLDIPPSARSLKNVVDAYLGYKRVPGWVTLKR